MEDRDELERKVVSIATELKDGKICLGTRLPASQFWASTTRAIRGPARDSLWKTFGADRSREPEPCAGAGSCSSHAYEIRRNHGPAAGPRFPGTARPAESEASASCSVPVACRTVSLRVRRPSPASSPSQIPPASSTVTATATARGSQRARPAGTFACGLRINFVTRYHPVLKRWT